MTKRRVKIEAGLLSNAKKLDAPRPHIANYHRRFVQAGKLFVSSKRRVGVRAFDNKRLFSNKENKNKRGISQMFELFIIKTVFPLY